MHFNIITYFKAHHSHAVKELMSGEAAQHEAHSACVCLNRLKNRCVLNMLNVNMSSKK